MSLLGETIETFEGEGERIFWVPAITLGYVFYLTGSRLDLVVAILAVTGGEYYISLFEAVETVESVKEEQAIFSIIRGQANSIFGKIVLYGVVGGYSVAVIYGLRQLWLLFSHKDIVLVGL